MKQVLVGIVGTLTLTRCLSGAPHRAIVGGAPVAADAVALDEETVVGRRHFGRGWPADNPDASTNALVEIPAGTTGKFEVDEEDGRLKWKHDRDTGRRREVDYLPFPVRQLRNGAAHAGRRWRRARHHSPRARHRAGATARARRRFLAVRLLTAFSARAGSSRPRAAR